MRCAVALLVAIATSAVSATETAQPAGRTFTGTVRFQGKTVTGATVRAVWPSYIKDVRPELPTVTTDAQGRFTVPWPADFKQRLFEVLAHDAQGRLGWLDFHPRDDLIF